LDSLLNARLGFYGSPAPPAGHAVPWDVYGSQVPNLSGPQFVYLESAALTNGGGSLDGRGVRNNAIFPIPLDVPYGHMQTWVMTATPSGPMFRWPGGSNGDTTTVDFRISDEFGNVLFFLPPHEVSVAARMWYQETFND
jgi:hypothetical protein